MSRWRLAVVMILLTLAPVQAHAECAWVLWVDDSQDSPLGAFSTKEECETRKQVVASQREKFGLSERLNCYPDTLDPRPKGWYAVSMMIKDVVEGPQMMTLAILVGGVGISYVASRSGRRAWLWFAVGMFVTSLVFGVVRGVVRAFSQ